MSYFFSLLYIFSRENHVGGSSIRCWAGRGVGRAKGLQLSFLQRGQIKQKGLSPLLFSTGKRTKTKREFFLSPMCLVAPSLFHAWADRENGGFWGGQNWGTLGMKKVHCFPNIKYVPVVLVQKTKNYHLRSISPSLPHPSKRRACAERIVRESKRENHPGFISFSSSSFFVVWDLELGKSRFDKSRKPRKKEEKRNRRRWLEGVRSVLLLVWEGEKDSESDHEIPPLRQL